MAKSISFPLVGVLLAIDFEIGIQYLHDYFHEQDLHANGYTFAQLGYDTRKEKSNLIGITNGSFTHTIKDIEALDSVAIDENSIVEFNYDGVMRSQDGLCSSGIDSLISKMYQAQDFGIRAQKLNLNTGGGEANAGVKLNAALGDLDMYSLIHANTLGSAGILGTLNADHIMGLSPMSKFGSIGSFISFNQKSIDKYKEHIVDIYADGSGDKNAGFRALLESGNQDILKKEVSAHAKQFREAVVEARDLRGDVDETLRGGMFTGDVSLEKGLIHSIGGRNDAIELIQSNLLFN